MHFFLFTEPIKSYIVHYKLEAKIGSHLLFPIYLFIFGPYFGALLSALYFKKCSKSFMIMISFYTVVAQDRDALKKPQY